MRRPKLKFDHGAWRVLFYEPGPDGKLRARMVTLLDEAGHRLGADAGKRAVQRALLIAEHEQNAKKRSRSKLTVAGMFDRYLIARGPGIRPSTLRSYRMWCAAFTSQYGPLPVRAVTIRTCEEWRAGLLERYSAASVNIAVRTVRAAFSWAVDVGEIHENPVSKLSLVRIQQETAPAVISWEQFERVIRPRVSVDRYRLIYMLALYAGLRRGEILALRWEHIDFAAGAIRVHNTATFQTKSGRARQVPILAALRAELEIAHARRRSPYVVGWTGKGQPNDTRWVAYWHALIKRLNVTRSVDEQIPDIRIHDLRASFCTELLSRLPPAVVQQILGHADVQTTMRYYAHLDQSTAFQAAKIALEGT